MFAVTAHLKSNCPMEVKRRFIEQGFSIYLVNHITGQMELIAQENIVPYWAEYTSLYCIANLCQYPGAEIHELLQLPEVQHRRIEDI